MGTSSDALSQSWKRRFFKTVKTNGSIHYSIHPFTLRQTLLIHKGKCLNFPYVSGLSFLYVHKDVKDLVF